MRVILLDIEGTTTPVNFVYEVLFPYARGHAREFLQRHHQDPEVGANIESLRAEHAADLRQGLGPPVWQDAVESRVESAGAYLQWLMDRDRKSTALKSLQGKIWEAGYQSRELRGEVYPDVPAAFARWHKQKRDVCIFSSGSILAQKLLFQNTTAGDLTRYLRTYFDTTTGPKMQAESYGRIAQGLRLPASAILFLSDTPAELDAARLAGMQTALCVRPGLPEPATPTHPVIHTFDEVFP